MGRLSGAAVMSLEDNCLDSRPAAAVSAAVAVAVHEEGFSADSPLGSDRLHLLSDPRIHQLRCSLCLVRPGDAPQRPELLSHHLSHALSGLSGCIDRLDLPGIAVPGTRDAIHGRAAYGCRRRPGPGSHLPDRQEMRSRQKGFAAVLCESEYKSLYSSRQLSALASCQTRAQDMAEIDGQKSFRITEPLIHLTMLMVSLPVLICRDPKAMKSAILVSFALTAACFAANVVCKLLSTEVVFAGRVMPELWAWLPVFILLPIAFIELDTMRT